MEYLYSNSIASDPVRKRNSQTEVPGFINEKKFHRLNSRAGKPYFLTEIFRKTLVTGGQQHIGQR